MKFVRALQNIIKKDLTKHAWRKTKNQPEQFPSLQEWTCSRCGDWTRMPPEIHPSLHRGGEDCQLMAVRKVMSE